MAQQEKIFVDGLRFERPNEKAPAWVKGKISIKIDSLIEFLEAHRTEKGWINIDLKESKKGVLYLELNTWKKGDYKPKAEKNDEGRDDAGFEASKEIIGEDIPF